jgi:hypothetical protein
VAGQVVNGTNTGVHSLEEEAGNCKESGSSGRTVMMTWSGYKLCQSTDWHGLTDKLRRIRKK